MKDKKYKEIEVKLDEPLIDSDVLVDKFESFHLTSINTGDKVVELGKEGIVGKPFVPHLDKALADNERILQYISVLKGITLRGNINLKKGEISVTGSGAVSVIIACEYK